MRNGFLVLTQWSQLSLKYLRNSCLIVSPLFQPMASPAKTDLTTGLAFSQGFPGTQGRPATFRAPLQPLGPFAAQTVLGKREVLGAAMYAMDLSTFQSRSTYRISSDSQPSEGSRWNHPHLKVNGQARVKGHLVALQVFGPG